MSYQLLEQQVLQKRFSKKGESVIKILEKLLLSFIKNMEKTDWKYGLYLKPN
jgi:hypothetical protein